MRRILVALVATMSSCAPLPAADLPFEVRAGVGFDALHGQGYWSPGVRLGNEWGLRVGLLKAPMWAADVPGEIKAAKPQFDLTDVAYYGVEREFCGERWCGALGIARLSRLTELNGTKWNFMLGLRYKFSPEWSGGLIHFSHGSMLGIERDKANSGWNVLNVERTWR